MSHALGISTTTIAPNLLVSAENDPTDGKQRNQARVEGFLVFQFADRYEEGMRQMADWISTGKLKYWEEIAEGLENTPRTFIGMLKGANSGKQLVKVHEP